MFISRSRHLRPATTVALATVVALTTLTACSSSSPGVTTLDTSADVTLTWWTGQADQAQTILEGLADEFEAAHPNVTIKVSSGAPSTEDLLQKMSASFAGGTYPDISYAFGAWASELAHSGRTLDITEKVVDPDVRWDEFSGAARETARPTGEATIGFPAVVDNISLIYNTTVFDAADVAYPTEDWTWEDFRTAAKALTDPATNTYGYGYSVSGSEETTWQFWPHLWQNGGEILSEDETTAAFNSAAGVEALTFLQRMAVDDASVYLDQTDTKFTQLFASDRIAMITSGPWALYDMGVAGTSYGVVQLPGTDGDHTTVSGPDLWVLFDHKDANREHWAYEFTKWLTDSAQDVRWNVAYGNLPLRASEIDSPEFIAQAEAMPGLDVMAANGANATRSRPTVSGYVNLSEAMGTAISRVLQGQGDPQSALDEAADKATAALAD
ncbi:carbohydrate ABC transporter substrate-binding protein, CUT1 family [Sanguibacter gelidistatuariae]|uniref:Carbohydrate ABC transporter substrate-binding protein, CUT1 family n=1 Tax=Sanguibacter gelidistatuariae TaxID=1814289 RepID=A0A1G6H8G8_9MICO|nr:ABC transporter substrate-binding protein [Sanguibacter gelidistatuariae]SDB90552.1 carbohydrate ABC transporter substrate-binding protein, CUT1 family [Sanguibacter gelidistatuariae]